MEWQKVLGHGNDEDTPEESHVFDLPANVAASSARIPEIGVLYAEAGPNLAAARASASVDRKPLRIGVLLRSSVQLPTAR